MKAVEELTPSCGNGRSMPLSGRASGNALPASSPDGSRSRPRTTAQAVANAQ